MNTRRNFRAIATVVIPLLLIAGILLSVPSIFGTSRPVAAEAPPAPLDIARGAPEAIVPALSPGVSEKFSGAMVEQTFTLSAGWNAVYLGVEPVNPSPLLNGVPAKSTIEAVFASLAASGELESVWTYNQPASHKDYIIDPGEGLWDAPGWERYIPVENVGPDGKSRSFLTNLYTLHANTAYLVKLKDNLAAPVVFSVSGKPVPGHHRWSPAAYNLAGFPLTPGGGATVGAIKAASPITEIRAVTVDGKWAILADEMKLQHGEGYLIYYADRGANGSRNFAAPLDLQQASQDGLAFVAGFKGRQQAILLENRTAIQADVTLETSGGSILLSRVDDATVPPTVTPLPQTITLAPNWAARVTLQVDATQLAAPGEAVLIISSTALGSRWLVPVTAKPGSFDGLWAGEVVVNDVSEARLGATDLADNLTISLSQRNASLVRGSAQLHGVAGSAPSVQVAVTLALPEVPSAPVTPIAGTAPHVGGYVFVDDNANGQRDATEPGLSGVTVTLAGSGSLQTGPDGSYVFSSVAPGSHTISAAIPGSYATAFDLTLPGGTVAPNSQPVTVVVGTDGVSGIAPAAYLQQILPAPHTLPYYDATGARVQPAVNFGVAMAHVVKIRGGTCELPTGELHNVGTAINGRLQAAVNADLAALTGSSHLVVEQQGQSVACGNIVVGAPTKFADGRGSEFRFRLLLRVRNGVAELLPHYAFTTTVGSQAFPRLSSAALSVGSPLVASELFAADNAMRFTIGVEEQDPLNPFKHKYHPDHDNLDSKFNEFPEDLSPYLWESFEVKRRITLMLKSDPVIAGLIPEQADKLGAGLDWGGQNWGGDYTEVLEGLHQNDITVKGYFVIRHVLAGDELVAQDYDQ